jgi:2-phospho-L-lactate guanylyltransferase (CobY/MobA/RfbA family)
VALGRAQVLADGEDLDAGLAHLAERVHQLLVGLAEPTIRPDLVATSPSPISSALRSTRSERSSVEPRRATGTSRGQRPRRCG